MTGSPAICPICGSAGKLNMIYTPRNARQNSWRSPGTYTAFYNCEGCGFEGHHTVICEDAAAAAGMLKATIGGADDAAQLAYKYFTAGRGIRKPAAN